MNTDQANDLEAIRRALFTGQKSAAKSEAQEAFGRIAQQLSAVWLVDAWAAAQPVVCGVGTRISTQYGKKHTATTTEARSMVAEFLRSEEP